MKKIKWYKGHVVEDAEPVSGDGMFQDNPEKKEQEAAKQAAIDKAESDIASVRNRQIAAKSTYDNERKRLENDINQFSKEDGSADKIVAAQNDIRRAKTTYEDVMRTEEKNLIELNKTIAENGGNITSNIIESLEYRYSRKLYESVMSKKSDVEAILTRAFNSVEISNTPDARSLSTFARNMNTYLRSFNPDGQEDLWEKLRKWFYGVLKVSVLRLADREIAAVIEAIRKEFVEGEFAQEYKWLFKNTVSTIEDYAEFEVDGDTKNEIEELYSDEVRNGLIKFQLAEDGWSVEVYNAALADEIERSFSEL